MAEEQSTNEEQSIDQTTTLKQSVDPFKLSNEGKKNACLLRGGRWDEETQKCIRKEEEEPKLEAPTPETFTDPATGRAVGITIPQGEGRFQIPDESTRRIDSNDPTRTIVDTKSASLEEFNAFKETQTVGGKFAGSFAPTEEGRTFLGLGPEDVERVAAGERERVARPEGTAPIGSRADLRADLIRKIRLAKTVGQIDFATAQSFEEQPIDIQQAINAGVLTGGAAAGAAATTLGGIGLLGGPVGSAIGAGIGGVGGAITGFFTGLTGNIKAQRTDLVTVKTKELRKRTTAINTYISSANMNPSAADDMVLAMNNEFSLIRRDYNLLNRHGQEDLRFWGSDATPQIVEYKAFFESVKPSLELKMKQAIAKPDPTRAFMDLEPEDI